MSEYRILIGDAQQQLATLPDASVQCCVTSPPYWGLRDYGHDGQIGLEETPDAFVARLVDVFREVRRVLRADGTAWVNMGDSYAAGGMSNPSGASTLRGGKDRGASDYAIARAVPVGLKPKDLVGVPWLLAFALRADGWYLRQDIIWHKPNPMPESVRDRCTKSHEHVFLLSKSARYYYDADAISEPATMESQERRDRADLRLKPGWSDAYHGNPPKGLAEMKRSEDGTRNKRDVWTISTKPSGLEHFAAFPPELPETCIRAGSKIGDTILDPFSGTGTTGIVAVGLNRRYVGCELNPKYAEMSLTRYREARGLFAK